MEKIFTGLLKFRKKSTTQDRRHTQLSDIWYSLRRNKTAVLGLTIIVIIVLLAIFADVIADYDTQAIAQYPSERLQLPSREHFFGTDAFGRDLFARAIHGARYSLIFGIGCTSIAMIGGSIIGSIAAYHGGRLDNIIMRILDAIRSIPFILLALTLIAVLGLGIRNMIIALSIASIPSFSRYVRSVVLNVVTQEFVEAARASGVSNGRIIFTHIIPNAIGPIIINAAMSIAGLIISAAGLSFIGMGVQQPAPEWGAMLSESTKYMRLYPHLVIVPGLSILVTALAFNLLGDGLVDALDPRMRD